MSRITSAAAITVALLAIPHIAHAHASLEVRKAPAGSTYKAVMRITHGCNGSPVTTVKILIPEGVSNVKPMPKTGWQIHIIKRAGEHSGHAAHEGHGAASKHSHDNIGEVHWTGGNLPDGFFDEFVMRVALPDQAGKTIYFPTIQECPNGAHHWIQIPAVGKSRRDYKEPAPELLLTPRR